MCRAVEKVLELQVSAVGLIKLVILTNVTERTIRGLFHHLITANSSCVILEGMKTNQDHKKFLGRMPCTLKALNTY